MILLARRWFQFLCLLLFPLLSIGVVYVAMGTLAHAQPCICRAEVHTGYFLFILHLISNILYFYVYVHIWWGMHMWVHLPGSLGTGVISSFELPSMGAGSQTQFLWKNKFFHSLRHCPDFFHLKFWDRVSHWTWSLPFFQQALRFCLSLPHQCWG